MSKADYIRYNKSMICQIVSLKSIYYAITLNVDSSLMIFNKFISILALYR